MRIPRMTPPDELPPAIQVRTFRGDLKTVSRPEPVDIELQVKTFWLVLGALFAAAFWGWVHVETLAPHGFPELAPLARAIAGSIPSCRLYVDCGVQIVLFVITVLAAVMLGFWVLWRFALMRYAAKVEDETQ